ncbi:mfs general substrate transporter [Fusarium beomiforme]|uniref:Mfs general substrate transporter n=1 Tax=Fusarium beomiforme TaxID=44412 RepID=A0A9P5A784_9HYPO|nr:mfs general substrate transporter [Fusarium beomiforme]
MDNKAQPETTGKAMTIEDVQGQGSGVLLYEEDGQARKLPIPSSDPNDPLNFGIWRQRLIIAAVCMYGITGFGVIQSTSLFFGKLIAEYKMQTHLEFDPVRITDLASYPSLCMGLGNFFFVPLSMALGRRLAFILSNILLLGSVIWAAKSQSFQSHLAARCLQGLTAGVSDCLKLPIIVLDLSFLNKRSLRLVSYWTLTAVGSSLLLIAVPFIVDYADGNWRVNYWFWTAWAAFSLIIVLIAVPETLFIRPAAALMGRIHATDAYGTHRTFATVEAARYAGFEIDNDSSNSASRSLSMIFGGLVVLSLTYSQRLEMEPWHFSPSTVGTVQAGAAIGGLFGLAYGEMTEPVSRYLTRRNGGLREPEHVLPNFILPSAVAFLGMIVYGVVGAEPANYSWVGVHAAFALYYFGFCALSAITGVWLGELLPHMSGSAIVLVCGGRNAVSFGYSHSFGSWITSLGFRHTYILFGGVLFALGSLAIPLYFVNARIRKAMSGITWLKSY